MGFTIYDATVPVFAGMLRNMRAWLDKPGLDPALIDARLAPDMRPLSAQYQFASDCAKFAVARLCGIEAPAMADTEANFAELQARCDRTIAFIEGADQAAFAGADVREIVLKFPNGMGYRLTGTDYLTGFALPNFHFHATTAYAILRNAGVAIGKPDYLAHLGMPVSLE